MAADLFRAIIQTIFRDKILMGLVFVGIIAIVSAGAAKDDKKAYNEIPANAPANVQAAKAAEQADPTKAASAEATKAPDALEPQLATQFIQWWLTGAMDYKAQTCQNNHTEALKWMDAPAADNFKAAFWTPEMEHAFSSGALVASFQPTAVEAKAINPDGTVVVSVTGALVMQTNQTQPTTQHVMTDYLVKKEPQGLRIAALHNRTTQIQTPSYY